MTEVLERPSRLVPWYGAGADVSAAETAKEATAMAGLNFEVEARRTAFEQDGRWVVNPGRVHIVRTDVRGPAGVIGIASHGYERVQYEEAFGFVDAISPHFVAAGPLRGGRQGFMVVQVADENLRHLDLEVRGSGDRLGTFIVMRTSHDLSRGIELSALMLRFACTNQITGQAFAQGAPWRWSVRHVPGARERLLEAQRILLNVPAYRDSFADAARRLGDIELTIDQAREAVTQVLSYPRSRPKTGETVERILGSWQESPTVGFFPSAWGLVNAVNEDIEWGRHRTRTGGERKGNRHEARLLGALQGASLKYTNRAAHLLLRRYGR